MKYHSIDDTQAVFQLYANAYELVCYISLKTGLRHPGTLHMNFSGRELLLLDEFLVIEKPVLIKGGVGNSIFLFK